MRTQKTGVVSSIPPCVAFRKTLLVRKATGNHLTKSATLERLRASSLVSATLEIEHAMQYSTYDNIGPINVASFYIFHSYHSYQTFASFFADLSLKAIEEFMQ